ncbi:hypothetical protein J7L36_00805 [bacterium]|nr:hypothetical protein [bacterium]
MLEKRHKNIAIKDAILYAIYLVNSDKGECTFEHLVKKCFDIFPKDFSLSNYPQWPDTRKIDRPLRRLRQQGLVKNNKDGSYALTRKGEELAARLTKILKQQSLFKI